MIPCFECRIFPLLSTKHGTPFVFLSLLIKPYNIFPSLSINRPKYGIFSFPSVPCPLSFFFPNQVRYLSFSIDHHLFLFVQHNYSMFGILSSSVHQPLLLAVLFFLLHRLPSNYDTFPSLFTNFALCLASFLLCGTVPFPSLSSPSNNCSMLTYHLFPPSSNPSESNNNDCCDDGTSSLFIIFATSRGVQPRDDSSRNISIPMMISRSIIALLDDRRVDGLFCLRRRLNVSISIFMRAERWKGWTGNKRSGIGN